MSSVSMMPEQVVTIRRLVAETEAFAVEISGATQMSLDVMTFTRLPDCDEDADAFRCRFFNVSVAGTVRERETDDQQPVAA